MFTLYLFTLVTSKTLLIIFGRTFYYTSIYMFIITHLKGFW